MEDIQAFARLIRKEIVETTGCTASAGIAGNMLMARLATRTAKPDGQCCIPPEKVKCLNLIYLSPMRIGEMKESGNLNEYHLFCFADIYSWLFSG